MSEVCILNKKKNFWYGFYGSVALYRLYRAGECVVNVRVSECAGLVEMYYTTPPVGSYHLAPSSNGWILLPPIPLGECAEFDGIIPFYTPEQWAYSIIPQPTGGKS